MGRAKKLTETSIARTKAPETGRLQVADAVLTGLWLRITSADVRSWSIMYRVPGRKNSQRVTIGRWPAIGVAEARRIGRDVLMTVERGEDPAAIKREQRQRSDNEFEAVAAEFIQRLIKPRQRRWHLTEALLNNKLTSVWRGRSIDSIKKHDVLKVLDREMDAGHHRTANQTFQLTKRLFGWALERDYIKADPTAGISRPAKERSRDRVLNDDELAAIFKAAGELGWPFGPFTQLLALLAQRRSEVAEARWQDIDFDKRLWVIPKEKTKSGRAHEVPLSSEAVAIFESLFRIDGDDRVFPTTRERIKDGVHRSISGFSKSKRKLDKLSGVSEWTFHDLRRTAVSGMAKLGVMPHVLSAVLNHDQTSVQGITAIYNRTKYEKEKRQALDRWGQHIASVTTASEKKVVAIR